MTVKKLLFTCLLFIQILIIHRKKWVSGANRQYGHVQEPTKAQDNSMGAFNLESKIQVNSRDKTNNFYLHEARSILDQPILHTKSHHYQGILTQPTRYPTKPNTNSKIGDSYRLRLLQRYSGPKPLIRPSQNTDLNFHLDDKDPDDSTKRNFNQNDDHYLKSEHDNAIVRVSRNKIVSPEIVPTTSPATVIGKQSTIIRRKSSVTHNLIRHHFENAKSVNVLTNKFNKTYMMKNHHDRNEQIPGLVSYNQSLQAAVPSKLIAITQQNLISIPNQTTFMPDMAEKINHTSINNQQTIGYKGNVNSPISTATKRNVSNISAENRYNVTSGLPSITPFWVSMILPEALLVTTSPPTKQGHLNHDDLENIRQTDPTLLSINIVDDEPQLSNASGNTREVPLPLGISIGIENNIRCSSKNDCITNEQNILPDSFNNALGKIDITPLSRNENIVPKRIGDIILANRDVLISNDASSDILSISTDSVLLRPTKGDSTESINKRVEPVFINKRLQIGNVIDELDLAPESYSTNVPKHAKATIISSAESQSVKISQITSSLDTLLYLISNDYY